MSYRSSAQYSSYRRSLQQRPPLRAKAVSMPNAQERLRKAARLWLPLAFTASVVYEFLNQLFAR